MILWLLMGGLNSALAVSCFKWTGELFQNTDTFGPEWTLAFFLALCGLVFAAIGLSFVNLAMKYFDQIDVAATYQTMILCSQISAGLLVSNEVKFYD